MSCGAVVNQPDSGTLHGSGWARRFGDVWLEEDVQEKRIGTAFTSASSEVALKAPGDGVTRARGGRVR